MTTGGLLMGLFIVCLIVGQMFKGPGLSHKLGKNCGKAIRNFAEKE